MKDEATTLITPASRHDPNLAWFRDARLWLFIHYSVAASRHGVSEHMQSQRRISDEDYRCEARTCALERFSAARRSGLLKWLKHTEEDDGA